MREKDVEQYLVDEVKKLGGVAYKFKSPQRRSVPDRLCVLPNGIIAFIECKATGEEPTPAQYREIDRLIDMGCWAFYVDRKSHIIKFSYKAKQMIGGD